VTKLEKYLEIDQMVVGLMLKSSEFARINQIIEAGHPELSALKFGLGRVKEQRDAASSRLMKEIEALI
jgi:hypothetical protein